ncbi:hypothetical protein [Halomonas chromatireducens]|uniref:Uncharacterized protein n=1 Tax=Halomonas chromatireducens TaxID=507626 RepID=A0A120JWC6_9GAMM|nr:hypothetical protein [Halomonas chromatireducens]AMD01719.1 hypothetical protein LOKO_02666 [Halomonas chromatireducens]
MSLPVVDPARYDQQLEAKRERIVRQFGAVGRLLRVNQLEIDTGLHRQAQFLDAGLNDRTAADQHRRRCGPVR